MKLTLDIALHILPPLFVSIFKQYMEKADVIRCAFIHILHRVLFLLFISRIDAVKHWQSISYDVRSNAADSNVTHMIEKNSGFAVEFGIITCYHDTKLAINIT